MLLLLLGLALLFVFAGAGLDYGYVIPKRLLRLGAMVVGGCCVALSAILFQTLVGNRILTPAVMGYESVYLLWQALLLLLPGLFGVGGFLSAVLLMLGYSWGLQRWLLSETGEDVYRLLLLGLVLSMLMGTATQFIQLRISPGEFMLFESLSQTSFNRVRPQALLLAALALAAVGLALRRALPVLDVLALGREQAQALGVEPGRQLRRGLAWIALLVAVSTSLIGPTALMGILVAHIAYALAGSSRHRLTLPLGCAVAVALFIAAQLLVEHVFNYRTTVAILVNLVCGAYFLALTLRARGLFA
ncbi:iron complex transport system permease protein [Paucibacter oligotrophus]|uniref:Iron complex transport system permease protein n=1 Tax=Roseateles oligotrophus TaxID=1769250 RepID=A0A840LHN8_9BURK|nr:iron chelate uptake ABC transporter family permease subunit [Roseateles oligotrophus]MBB4845728.1 iron complex transport system permease protein [Roseateles oligotrophus]